MSTQQLPRIQWRFKFPIGGFFSGVLAGFGLTLILQQAAIAYPTRNLAIALVVGGGIVAVLLRNVAALVGVSRLNSRLTKAEQKMAGIAGVVEAPAAATRQESTAVDEPTPVEVAVSADGAWAATHVVPSAGMPAWAEPDNTVPPDTQLEAGLELRVLERSNGLAHVEAYNGWTAWVEARPLRRKHA